MYHILGGTTLMFNQHRPWHPNLDVAIGKAQGQIVATPVAHRISQNMMGTREIRYLLMKLDMKLDNPI